MSINIKYLSLSIFSIIILISSFFYVYSNFTNINSNLIKFDSKNLNSNFEINISHNLEDIDNYLNNYKFIKSYIVKKNKPYIDISIVLKKPFAKNNLNQEIIFDDNSIASFSFFDQTFIDSIYLIDTSQESMQINNYLKNNFEDLKKIFKINQIEFIDERRYNLIIDDNIKIMLPKKIDKKLIIFIKKNLDLLKNNTDFKEYLDFRNFNDKTIRLK
jgi:hypothetical protein